MLHRRTFLGLGALCACAGAATAAFGQAAATTGKWICPPCGCASDGKLFDAPGSCPEPGCGMTLVPQAGPAPAPQPAPAPTPPPTPKP